MNGVPLAVLVGMLNLDLKWYCLFGHLSDPQQILLGLVDEFSQLIIPVTQLLFQDRLI